MGLLSKENREERKANRESRRYHRKTEGSILLQAARRFKNKYTGGIKTLSEIDLPNKNK